ESVRISEARSPWERAIARRFAQGGWKVGSVIVGRVSDATVRRAHTVVAMSHQARRLLLDRGIPDDRIRLIPVPARIPADDRAHGRNGDSLKVVTAGYASRRKAIEDVVVPVARLASRGFPISLDVIGDGPALPAVRDLARRLPGGDAVRFHGWLASDAA